MKTLISFLLILGIFSAYRWVNSVIHRDIEMTENTLGLSNSNAGLKRLEKINQYNSIFHKPLFDEDRELQKVVIAKKKVEKKVTKNELLVQAIGIALAGDNFLAVIKDLKSGKIFRLRMDESISGWTLTGVSENSLVFSRGEVEEIVYFRKVEE